MIEYLNWPKIPGELLEKTLLFADKKNEVLPEEFPIEKNDINWDISLAPSKFLDSSASKKIKEASFVNKIVCDDLQDWLEKNIPIKFDYAHVMALIDGNSLTPHIDGFRSTAYNYLVYSDSDSSTCFYKPKKQYSHLTAYPDTVFPYERLDLIYKESVKPRTWYKINTRIIHSVENLSDPGKRITITLSILN